MNVWLRSKTRRVFPSSKALQRHGFPHLSVACTLPIIALVVMLGAPAAQAETDHLVGYSLKDSRTVTPGSYLVDDVLWPSDPAVCTLSKAKYLMVAGEKDAGDDPRGGVPIRYVCYKARCGSRPDLPLAMSDQFGAGPGTVKTVKLVCAPEGTPCTGVEVGGFCWYLGASGQSCTQVCTGVGKTYSTATETYAGSGGTDANCGAVLDALGAPGTFVTSQSCGLPGECVVVGGAVRVRCTDTPADPDASDTVVQRACACQ